MEDWPPAIRCSSGRLIHLTVWIENPLASTDGSRVKTPSGPENNRLVHTTRSNRHLNVFSRLQPPCTACYWNRCNILYRWASIHFRCILNFKRLEVSYSLKKCSAFVAKCCCGRAASSISSADHMDAYLRSCLVQESGKLRHISCWGARMKRYRSLIIYFWNVSLPAVQVVCLVRVSNWKYKATKLSLNSD